MKRLARGRVRNPLWSPDGKKIVYATGFGNNLEIALVTRDGSHRKQLTHNHKLDQWPSWAPDSKRFVVERFDAGYSDYDHELFIVKADGSGERNLTSNKRHDICPSWSPDGDRIAFYRRPSYSIYTIRPDGKGERRLTSEPDARDIGPVWSPDGREILFVRHIPTPDGDPTTEEEDLFVVNRRGTKVRRVTRTPEAKFSYAWSPDGSKIAFIAYDGSDQSLWVVNRDGANLRRIGTDAVDFDSPTWSKGGTRIAYGRVASGDGFDIGIARPDGSSEGRLTTTGNASEGEPTWHSPAQQCSTGY